VISPPVACSHDSDPYHLGGLLPHSRIRK
jgi:hypothetical protein